MGEGSTPSSCSRGQLGAPALKLSSLVSSSQITVMLGFCGGEVLFLNSRSGLEDADSETHKQLTSAFSQPFPLQPGLRGL